MVISCSCFIQAQQPEKSNLDTSTSLSNNQSNTNLKDQNNSSGQEKKEDTAKEKTNETTENKDSKKNGNEEKKDGKEVSEKKDKDESDKKEEEKPKSPHTFTGSISFVSDYRFRGISQTMRRPAVQGTLDYSNANGIYLSTFGSNASGATNFYNNTCMEWDFYGGYKGKLFPCRFPDFAYNIGFIYYYYPGGQVRNHEHTRYDTGEFYIELSYKWLSVKYWQTVTNYFGIDSDNPSINFEDNRPDRPNGSSRGSSYIEANLSFDLYNKTCFFRCLEGGKLNLLLHVGHQTIRHYENLSYTDWKVMLTQEFAWFNIFVYYVGTNAKHDYYDVPDNAFHPHKRHLGAQAFVVGVIRSF